MGLISLNNEVHHVAMDHIPTFSKQIQAKYADLFKEEIGKLPVT